MAKRVTIKDVAKHAGVSFKTVARVVSNERNVRKSNRIKVESSIETLGYEVDPAARSLRSTHAYSLGLVFDHPMADVQMGVLKACHANDYSLQIQPCYADESAQPETLIRAVRRSKLSALVLTPPISENSDYIRGLIENDIPFVAITSGTTPPDVDYPCVYVNDRRAAYDITQHLIQLGHRNIGFIWGDESHKSSHERFRGYSEALREYGIDIKKSHVQKGEYSFDSGRRVTTKLLKLKNRVTAIIGSNDEIAAGAILAARIADVGVPNELSIVGFEDSLYSKCSWPQITTARQPTEEIAFEATQMLIRHLNKKLRKANGEDLEISLGFTPQLVVKGSTGPVTMS